MRTLLLSLCYFFLVVSGGCSAGSRAPTVVFLSPRHDISAASEIWWRAYTNVSSNSKVFAVSTSNISIIGDGMWALSNASFHGVQSTDVVEVPTKYDRNLLSGAEMALSRRITAFLPPFAPSSSSHVTNPECIRDSQLFLRELDNLSLWALKMHDANAKLPAGLLNGNVNQYGDFDQCLAVRAEGGRLKGRYCLATLSLGLSNPERPQLRRLYSMVQSHFMIRSELDDPGHRVPRFSSIHWGVCVPASCSPADVQISLNDTLQQYINDTGFTVNVKVFPELCQVQRDDSRLPLSTYIVIGIFTAVIAFTLISTYLDPEWIQPAQSLSSKMKLIQAFSLRKNVLALFSMTRSADDIESVHGIRAINALMLIFAHKSMALFFLPFTDRTVMAEALGKPWTVFARVACLYTDPFIMMSGLLTSYAFLRQLEQNKRLHVLQEYISRLMRLVPNLVALMLFCTFILPWINTGPMWNQVVQHHSDICKVTWWRNLIFIHNYFGFENMCLTHTHHLGIDTQLFVISPLLVYIIWKWPRSGLGALCGIAAISTALRYNVTYTNNLSHFVMFGSSITQMFKTADLSYILPSHRATVYVMGIALGLALRYCGRNFRLKKRYLTLGWTAAMICFYLSLISPSYMAHGNYVYNPLDAARFAAFAPIFWCLFFGWVIFTSYIGYGGLVGQILSWRGFLVTTRLSYALYLTQFPIFFYYVGINRINMRYSVFLMFDPYEFALIIAASIIMTLLFDLPFQNLRSILLKKPKKT